MKIERTVVTVTTEHRKERTKTPDSNRVYYLTPDMEQFFQNVLKKKKENQLFYGDTYIHNKEIFVLEDGHNFRPDYVYHHFKSLAEKFGRPDMTFHALRHSTASMLFELGWHPKEIQDWLGHADFYTTMNIYTHIQKSLSHTNAERLVGVLMPPSYVSSTPLLEQVLEWPQKTNSCDLKQAG